VATPRKYKPRGYRDGGLLRRCRQTPSRSTTSPWRRRSRRRRHCRNLCRRRSQMITTRWSAHCMRRRVPKRSSATPRSRRTINAIPGLSEHKRAFLRGHPNLLEPANVNAVRFHYHAARNAGVTDDSPEMNRAILDGIAHDRLDRARVALPMDGRHDELEPSSAEPSDAVGGRSGGLWSAGSKPRSGGEKKPKG
jgi:hypothetical protein